MLRIKELLKEKKITTYQLAEKLDITQSAVSQTINGNPTVGMLKKIADALGVTVPDLFEKTEGDFKCPNCGSPINISVELAKQKE